MGLEPSTAGWKALTNPQSYGATPTTLIFVLIDGSTSLRVIFKHGRSSASLLFIFRLLQQYNFQNVINYTSGFYQPVGTTILFFIFIKILK